MEEREEREQRIQWWIQLRREAGKKFIEKFTLPLLKTETTEERNDVYLYKTLRYPPTRTPPTIE